jgi:First Longin domain of INTU, CCZ1 and HPS4
MSLADYEVSKQPKLRYFCIYNPDFDVQGDNLEEQIAFYYSPNETTIHEQLRHIGVAQGVVELSKEFSDGVPCHTMETQNSCIVVKEIEQPNWWVVACIEEKEREVGDSDESVMLPSELFTMSIPELLIAQIQEGYRRWRLYHGRFQDYMVDLENKNKQESHKQLLDGLAPWWTAWCKNWQVSFHEQGVVSMFNDYIRLAKGQLLQATSEAVQAVVDKEAMVDMIVTGNGSPNPENNGCLWYSRNKDHKGGLSSDSIIDLVDWVNDCYNCHNDNAFLEPSGFVYHLKSLETSSKTSTKDVPAGSSLLSTANYDMNSLTAPLANMGTAISNATIDSVNNFMERVNLKSFSIGRGKTPVVQQLSNPDDLGDSRFLIGLMGDLEGDGSSEEPRPPPITKRSLFVKRKEADSYIPVNVVVYRRRPFTFILLFDTGNQHHQTLDNPAYYVTLHRRLASLSEPFLSDFNDPSQERPKFYYLVVDPSTQSLQSSLPSIPDLPPPHLIQTHQISVERTIQERLEMIHVHQNLCQIWIESNTIEQEKFVRTSRNWWIYLTRLPDNRKVLFARKWSKQGKPPGDSSGLLGAVGRDAKIWLDEYKYYGKV